jgi:hypothetical protein
MDDYTGTSAAVPAMARLAGDFRRRGRPIVHIVRLYFRDGSNAEWCRRHALERGAGVRARRDLGAVCRKSRSLAS